MKILFIRKIFTRWQISIDVIFVQSVLYSLIMVWVPYDQHFFSIYSRIARYIDLFCVECSFYSLNAYTDIYKTEHIFKVQAIY